ncbi:MAG: hypothetical protein P8J45_00005, partial [Phycisphaerales bacterium]|nr:hypothetical protein [Phycisphaerales bacterium]
TYDCLDPDDGDIPTPGGGADGSAASDDFDNDGLTNHEETHPESGFGTNPCLSDTDYDGLSDYDEIHVYETNPLLADTDGDGLNDDIEVAFECLEANDPDNPNDPNGDPDGDNTSTAVEVEYGLNPCVMDPDTDGDGTIDYFDNDLDGPFRHVGPYAGYPSIQAAIDEANDGDTIVVVFGTWTGEAASNAPIAAVGAKRLSFLGSYGKELTILDDQDAVPSLFNRGLTWEPDAEGAALSVDGFTVKTRGSWLTVSGAQATNATISNTDFVGFEDDNVLQAIGIDIEGGCTLAMSGCDFSGSGSSSWAQFYQVIDIASNDLMNLSHTLTDCTFTNIYVNTGGGREVVKVSEGTLTILECMFTDNRTSSDIVLANRDLLVQESSFIGNQAKKIINWWPHTQDGYQASINESLFQSNVVSGGTVYTWAPYTSESLASVNACTFEKNSGPLYSRNGVIVVTDSLFTCNNADGDGVFSNQTGGILIGGYGTATITGCSFIENIGQRGSGIHVSSLISEWIIEDCWFEANVATENVGAAVYRAHGTASAHTIRGCTVTGHTTLGPAFATDGGASNASKRIVEDSVFCNNVQDFDDVALWTITDCQQEVDCGDISYDAATSEELTEALENAVDGSTISITQGGFYDIGSLDTITTTTLTITNTSGELVTLTGGIEIDPGGSYEGGLAGGSLAIVFEGITIEGSGSSEGLPAYGGGILVRSGDVMLINCTLRNLEATGAGGALYVGTFCSVTLLDSVLENNTAPIGGAAYVEDGGFISLIGTTLCGNGVELEEQIYGAYDIDEESCIVADCTDNDGDGTPDGCGAPPCPADIDGSGSVDGADLSMLLGAWGVCTDPGDCPADIDGDGAVTGADLSMLLGAWGACPE